MMTPERSEGGDEENPMGTPMGVMVIEPVSEPVNNLEDSIDQEGPSETMEDEPSEMVVNDTLNSSVNSENCKIINESDEQQSPRSPDPDGVTTMSVMNGSMIGNDVVPDAANLTPVKLDAGLKEQETFTSSPSNSRDERSGVNDSLTESRPLSRRQQHMRVVKCYSAVAIIVLVLAIGIPLGAVMLFKSNSEETSFAGASEEDNSPSTTEATTVPVPPPYEEETPEHINPTMSPFDYEDEVPKEVTEAPEVVQEDVDDEEGTTDAPADFEEIDDMEEVDETQMLDDQDGTTDAPFFEFPVENDVESQQSNSTNNDTMNMADFLDELLQLGEQEQNITTDATFPPVVDDGPDVPEEVTEIPTEPEETTFTDTPTSSPTAAPTIPSTPGPDRSGVYFDLINVTSPAVLQDMTSPQALSYLWLVEKDQLLPIPEGRYLLQRYILVVLDHVMHDPYRPTLSNPVLDHCLWEGVVCDLETGDVKEINWRLQGLNGRLIEEIKHLDSLERLDLSENDLVGGLDVLYDATFLKQVYLHNNQFSGPLTEQIGQLESLEALYLGHNELTGNIPLSLRADRGTAKPLRWLILSHNKFSGYLPPDWRMRNLFHLDLGHNMLSGPLPNDWDVNMVRLRHLYLDHNQFTGLLPAYFGQLGNGRLKQLHLNDNLLEGKVPENWDPKDQLTNMAVHNNMLTVPVHPRVCELSVFELGVMVEFRTDCDICTCDFLCEMCVE